MTGRHSRRRIGIDELRGAADAEVLSLWLQGYPEGLDELAHRHHGWMLRTVRHLSIGERDAEAIVQDAWLDVMRGAPSYRGTGSVRGWLDAIIRRRISTTWRACSVRPQRLVDMVPDHAPVGDGLAEVVVLSEALRGLLARLPEDQRMAVWLIDVVGMTVSEAADRLGVPPGTIKSRCHRGRTRLRLLL